MRLQQVVTNFAIGTLGDCLLRSGFIARALLALAFAVASGAVTNACPTPPAPVRDINAPRFYADAEGSIVDPKLAAAHKAAVAPLNAFLRHVVGDADKALRRTKPEAQREAADCALRWLDTWAKGNAWLGRMESRQAEYQRKWDLAGVALAYIKVRSFATPAQRQSIEPWLLRFADAARSFFDDPARRRNNHWYWLGLGLGATAIATDSDKHWQMARGIILDAARDVGPDGTLPHEMERGARALHYHAFAVMPLVVLAELAAARGEDWYGLENAALHRLAKATLDGLAEPALFDKRAGIAQERPVNPGAGWTLLYSLRHPDRLKAPLVESPEGHRWLGGDVLLLRQAQAHKP